MSGFQRLIGDARLVPYDTARQRPRYSGAFDEQDAADRSALANLLGRSVFRGIVESARPIHALELGHDDTLRPPIAFLVLDTAAAHDKLAAVFGEHRSNQLFVLLVAERVGNLDGRNQVSRHAADLLFTVWSARLS